MKLKVIIINCILILLLILTIAELILGFSSSSPFSVGNTITAINPPTMTGCSDGNVGNFLNNVATFMITPITNQVNMVSQQIFTQIVDNPVFHRIVFIALTLYVVIWGIYIALGFTQTTLKDFIGRMFKIGIVLSLLNPYSYDFFNKYLFNLFVAGSQELIGMVTDPYCHSTPSKINYFAFTNYAMNAIFGDPNLLLRLSGLIMAFPIGWLCFIIFCQAIVAYFIAILRAIIAYLIAYTAVGLAISLAPIFIITILFDKTKGLFNEWLKVLVSFAMEPVILFATIVLITIFVQDALYNVMGELNWLPFLDFHINFKASAPCGDFPDCIDITSLYWYLPHLYMKGISSLAKFQTYIGYVENFIVLAICINLLGKVGEFATMISSYLFGGAGMLQAANQAISSSKDFALGVIGMDSGSKKRRQEQMAKNAAADAQAKRAKRWGIK